MQTTPPITALPSLVPWTESYFGVSHFGTTGDERSATVTDRNGWAEALLWSRHSSIFQAPEIQCDSIEVAKQVSEAWVKTGVVPNAISVFTAVPA